MEEKNYEKIIEAILFTMGESVTLEQIAAALELDKNETKKCIDELIDTLKEGLPAKEIFVSNFVNVRYTSDFAKDKKLVQYIIKKYEFYNMNTNEVISQINYLSKKSRNEELSDEEKTLQAKLRQRYISNVKRNLRAQLEGVKLKNK